MGGGIGMKCSLLNSSEMNGRATWKTAIPPWNAAASIKSEDVDGCGGNHSKFVHMPASALSVTQIERLKIQG